GVVRSVRSVPRPRRVDGGQSVRRRENSRNSRATGSHAPDTRRSRMTPSVEEWVDEVARTTHPDTVIWCDGSDAENGRLIGQMVDDGTLIRLNQAALPGCYLHRSNPQDVARTEHLTFICSERPEDVGPTNN